MEFLNLKMDRLILLKSSEISERGEIVSLARSISKHGILVPITVRKILNTDRYEIVSGVKRFYANRMSGGKYIPAYVVQTPSTISRLIIKRNERQDMFEESEAIRTAMITEGLNAEELADATGYIEKEIIYLLRLSKMGEFERELVRRNRLSREAVCEIAYFDDICVRTELLSEAIKKRMTPAEVKEMCNVIRHGKRLLRGNRTPKFRDMRLFDNTVSRAISLLKDAGVKADMKSEQANGITEYKIRIEN